MADAENANEQGESGQGERPTVVTVEGQVFTVRERFPGVYDFSWVDSPIVGWEGFSATFGDGGALSERAVRGLIEAFVADAAATSSAVEDGSI